MSKTKRLWALLLTLAMVLTYMPAMAFAEGDEEVSENETTFAVTFDANGGWFYTDDGDEDRSKTTVENITYEGGYVEEPSNPTRGEAFSFSGWSLDRAGNNPVVLDNYRISENATFYAQWERQGYLVQFDAGDGGFFRDWEDAQVLERYAWFDDGNSDISSIDSWAFHQEPEKIGYVFDGWTDKNGKDVVVEDDTEITITEDTTYYAKWVKGVTITLESGDENDFEYYGKTEDTIVITKRANTILGYLDEISSSDGKSRVTAWTGANGRPIDPESYRVGNDSITLYAKWEKTLSVILHPGDGNFNNYVEEGEEDIVTFNVNIGMNLDMYAARYTENGAKVYDYDGHVPISNDGNKIFEGWYTDSALTKELNPAEVTDAYINEHDGILELYAKYTSDIQELRIHANGGFFYSNDDPLTIEFPKGAAINPSDGLGNEDENSDIVAWYTDEELTKRAVLSKDGYYAVAEGVTDLYPKWGERVDLEVYMETPDYRFFSDGDYEVGVRLMNLFNYEPVSTDNYNVEYTLEAREREDSEFVKLNNEEDIYFSSEEGRVILHGKALKELNYENTLLSLTAVVTDEDGAKICDNNLHIAMVAPYDDYGFDREEEESVQFLLVGQSRYYDRFMYGRTYNSQSPEGEDFEYEIIDVASDNEDVVSVFNNDGDFEVVGKKEGPVQLTIQYKDKDGKSKTERVDFEVDHSKYEVVFNSEDNPSTRFLIGEMLSLKVDGARLTYNENKDDESEYIRHDDGFEYKWKSDNEYVHVAEVEGKRGFIDVTADEEFLDTDDDIVTITAEIWAKGKCRASTEIEVAPRDFYYELANLPTVDEYMRKNVPLEISPELRFYNRQTENKEGYDVIPNAEFYINYDSSAFKVTKAKGNSIDSGDGFTGKCTITRISDSSSDFQIIGTFDGFEQDTALFWVNEIYNISKAKIVGVKNCVYTGKAISQNPDLTYVEAEGGEFALRKGADYTISYKNNTKVGTATMTIAGKGMYYGSVNKTFKIDKLTAAFSKSALTWNGKHQSPKPTVSFGKTKLSTSQYTVTYPKTRKDVGTYTATVTLKGSYSGKKNVSFTIIPKGTTISKLTKASKAFTASWKKQSSKMSSARVTGYQVQYSTKKNFKSGNKTVTVAGWSKTARKISGLKARTAYYARVRTYMKVGKTTYYSGWSAAKAVKTN